MEQKNMPETVCVLKKEDFFRPNQNFHIQMSNEFPDYIGVIHRHKYIEMVYIISGKATHWIEGQTYTATRGDLFIINMGTAHAFFREEAEDEPFLAYDLMFTPEFFDRSATGYGAFEELTNSFVFYSLFHEEQSFSPFISVSGRSHAMFGEILHKIYLEHQEEKRGYIEMIRAYMLQMIVNVFRINASAVKGDGATRGAQIVHYVTDYLRQNYHTHVSVKEMADRAYINRDYLGRVFREATGMSIRDMLQKIRLERVCELLSTSERTVVDIATSCGFDDMKNFYTIFKKHMGVLPGAYRKQTRNQSANGKKSENTIF